MKVDKLILKGRNPKEDIAAIETWANRLVDIINYNDSQNEQQKTEANDDGR